MAPPVRLTFSPSPNYLSWLTRSIARAAGNPNLNFLKSMEVEHASKATFSTSNYGIETCPAEEWRVVFECDTRAEKEYNRHMRRIPDWRQIMRKEQMQRHSGKEAPLTDVEVIAIILYTGPMVRQPIPNNFLLRGERCCLFRCYAPYACRSCACSCLRNSSFRDTSA